MVVIFFTAGDVGDYGPFNSPSLSVMARLLADEVAIPFGVVIREDRRVEHEEFFTARLTLPPSEGSNVKLGRVEMATVYIEDNDSKKSLWSTFFFVIITVRPSLVSCSSST